MLLQPSPTVPKRRHAAQNRSPRPCSTARSSTLFFLSATLETAGHKLASLRFQHCGNSPAGSELSILKASHTGEYRVNNIPLWGLDSYQSHIL